MSHKAGGLESQDMLEPSERKKNRTENKGLMYYTIHNNKRVQIYNGLMHLRARLRQLRELWLLGDKR